MNSSKITISAEYLSDLDNLTGYYRQLRSQQHDPSTYDQEWENELAELVGNWKKLNDESKGLIIWALNQAL